MSRYVFTLTRDSVVLQLIIDVGRQFWVTITFTSCITIKRLKPTGQVQSVKSIFKCRIEIRELPQGPSAKRFIVSDLCGENTARWKTHCYSISLHFEIAVLHWNHHLVKTENWGCLHLQNDWLDPLQQVKQRKFLLSWLWCSVAGSCNLVHFLYYKSKLKQVERIWYLMILAMSLM